MCKKVIVNASDGVRTVILITVQNEIITLLVETLIF